MDYGNVQDGLRQPLSSGVGRMEAEGASLPDPIVSICLRHRVELQGTTLTANLGLKREVRLQTGSEYCRVRLS